MDWALVPAYNEEKTIGEVVKRLKKVGLKVLVVDDGSKDRTYEKAKGAGAFVLRHAKNKGKGEAIKTGVNYLKRKAGVDNIVLIDADLQYLPEEAPRLLKPLREGKADMVMGKRDFSQVPFRHRLGNFVWRTAFNLLFGTNFPDTNCGYMAFSRKALKKIEKIHGGYIIENSFLEQALRKHLRVVHVPVTVVYRKISGIKRGIRMVLGVLVFIVSSGLRYRADKLLKRV